MSSFQDRQKILEDASKGTILGPDRQSFEYSSQLPDFEVNAPVAHMEISESQMKEKHPLEWIAEPMRINENPYNRMNQKSLLITNFPKGVNVTQRWLKAICMKYDPTAIINKIYVKEAQIGNNFEMRNPVSYAIVEFEMEKWVASVRRGLRKHWDQDKLLKVMTLKDQVKERHSERTIVISDLPSHIRPQDLATAMSNYGAITSIEAPTVDSFIQSQLEQKGLLNDFHTKERQLKKEEEYRYAQILLNDTLTFDKQFEELLTESWGEQQAKELINKQKDLGAQFTKVNMLDEEKLNTFMRVMAQLQVEGLQVEKSKSTLGSLAKEIERHPEGVPTMKKSHDDLVVEKKQSIEKTLKYLLNNQESLDVNQQQFLDKFTNDGTLTGKIDPIHKLQRMSIGELAGAYDLLLGILKQREELVKERLKESLKHFGREEKILYESQDQRKEQETMPDILRKLYDHDPTEIDRILGLNEQIQMVNIYKNLSPHEKLYQWLTNTGDFDGEKNWNQNQLARAQTFAFDQQREPFIPDSRLSKSDVAYIGQVASPFHAKYLERIQEEVEKYRNEMDTPFDEIYHKERKLVQDIVRAMQSIADIEAKLPNPAGNRVFDPKDLDEDPVYGDIYGSQNEPQYIRDKKLEEKMNSAADLAKFREQMGDVKHQYNEIERQTVEDLIKSGQIDRTEFEIAKANNLANRQVSLGYAFITYSHADEAKKALIKLNNEFYLDTKLVQVTAKGQLDHSEFDKSYFMKKMKNEAKLVEQRAELREARKNLRDFESNIDQELPSLKRLKDFKSIAQELIENPKGKTRRHVSGRRTKRETEELYEKLKEYQRENPNIDVTSLFETDKIDSIRRELHKRSFQSFKKFEFLKAGVSDDKPAPKKELFEPFNYPPLKETMDTILTDGITGRVNYSGLPLNNPGRRFDYTEQEFLEAYLGKDYTRKIDLNENEDNHVFGFQETLKKLFPDKSKYLKLPKLLKQQKQLEDFYGLKYEDGKAKDQKFVDYLNVVDPKAWKDGIRASMDHKNQDDPTRSKITDLKKELDLLRQKVEKSGTNVYLRKDIQKIYYKLDKEYGSQLHGDSHGALHRQFAEETIKEWEPFMEEFTPKAEEADRELDSDEEVEHFKAQVIERLSKYDPKAEERIAKILGIDKVEDEDELLSAGEDGEGFEEEFEENSMFDPNNKKTGEFVSATRVPRDDGVQFYEELDDDTSLKISKSKFGSRHLSKRSNENLYNLQHATKKGRLDNQDPNLKELRQIAKAMTDYRREYFNKVKDEQMSLPQNERVPHYLDENGMPVPYSQEQIEAAKPSQFVEDEGQANELVNVLGFEAEDVIRDISIADYLKKYKEFAPVEDEFVENTGEIYRYAQTYMDEKDIAEHKYRDKHSSKSLKEFVRDEEDIYDQYKMRTQKDQDKSKFDEIKEKLEKERDIYQKLQKIHDEANDNLIDTPTFDKYFRSEAKGVSSIDNFQTLDHERKVIDEEVERIIEAEQDELTYKKELMARMFGGKLTSRQFGVLMNMPNDEQDKQRLIREGEFKIEQDARDKIRCGEEIIEEIRRSKVLSGEWKEEESHQMMQMRIDEIQEKYPTQTALKIGKREEIKMMENLIKLRNSEALMQREYYFDEGLGQSLNEHTADLKEKFPNMTVQTRRDRDGLPIVKILMKPQYKYNLDEILAMDPKEFKRIQQETQEVLLQEFMPENQKDFLYKVGEFQKSFSGVAAKNGDYLTKGQCEKLSALLNQRFHGKYKDDLQGFKDQIQLIKNYKDGPFAMAPALGNPFTPEGKALASNSAFDELMRDQQIFDFEIQTQISLKIKDKLNFEQREQSDFVKFGRSETNVFRDQVQTLQDSMEILEKDNEWLFNAANALEKGEEVDGYFDEKKFAALKKEIKRKREAKERVLQQGFPEFKPYMRL